MPFLAESIPSIENGLLAKDGTSVTWKLRKGVKWSDGTDFTAKDVVVHLPVRHRPEDGDGDERELRLDQERRGARRFHA